MTGVIKYSRKGHTKMKLNEINLLHTQCLKCTFEFPSKGWLTRSTFTSVTTNARFCTRTPLPFSVLRPVSNGYADVYVATQRDRIEEPPSESLTHSQHVGYWIQTPYASVVVCDVCVGGTLLNWSHVHCTATEKSEFGRYIKNLAKVTISLR